MAVSLLLAGAAVAGCGVVVDRRATARETDAEAAFPPTGRFVTVDGARVHAQVQGTGPDVVLIHGAGGNLRDFTFDLVARLAVDHRVTAFDRPGLGFSDDIGARGASPLVQADHLQKAAALLGVKDPVVLGHSYGGAVAMAWALTDPGATRGVVSVAGATMPWDGGLDTWYHVTGGRIGGATLVPLLTAFVPEARTETALTGIFAPDAVPTGYAAHVGPGLTLRRGSLRANGRQVLALKDHLRAMSPNYPQLKMPFELIHGTADETVYARVHSIPLSQIVPNARLTLIEGAGHMPHHNHPDAVVAAVRRLAG
ncbi:MAG: alpha/beta fold hydrolase [Gemmobacter sp.]